MGMTGPWKDAMEDSPKGWGREGSEPGIHSGSTHMGTRPRTISKENNANRRGQKTLSDQNNIYILRNVVEKNQ